VVDDDDDSMIIISVLIMDYKRYKNIKYSKNKNYKNELLKIVQTNKL